MMDGVCYDTLSVAVAEGSSITVATGFSWTFLVTFLVRFVAVLFALTVFFAVVFDFLEALACLPFFFAVLRTISVVISFSSSYSVRKIALHRSKIGLFSANVRFEP